MTSIKTRYLLRRASPLMLDRHATLQIDGSAIAAVTSDREATVDEAYPDTLIVPALANAHDHGRGLKTLAYGAFDTAVEAWVPATYTLPPLDPYLVAVLAFARMARAGITSIVHCHVSSGGISLLTAAEAVARAARDVGVRVAFVVPLRDRHRLGYGDDDAILAHMNPSDIEAITARWLKPIAPIAEQLEMVDRIAEQCESPSFTVQYGPVGMEWCSDELLSKVAVQAARSNRRIHMHLLETRYQRQWTDAHYPQGPVQRLAELGLLSERLTLAHGTWLRPQESELLAQYNVTVSINTSSNLRLKSGIAPLPSIKAAQLRFAIGLDALALDDDDDILRELRLTHLLHGGTGFDRQMTCEEVFDAGSHAGACAVCGPGRAGELAEGAPADFIVLDYTKLSSDLHPGLDEPFRTFFTRASQQHIASVYCAGRQIVRQGRVNGIDEAALQQEMARQLAQGAPEIVALRPLLARFQHGLERFYAADGHLRGARPSAPAAR
jgi:cytosine/adenosine deaminase-related metal-dependent hydrolase